MMNECVLGEEERPNKTFYDIRSDPLYICQNSARSYPKPEPAEDFAWCEVGRLTSTSCPVRMRISVLVDATARNRNPSLATLRITNVQNNNAH